jgi:hypothetical protein
VTNKFQLDSLHVTFPESQKTNEMESKEAGGGYGKSRRHQP